MNFNVRKNNAINFFLQSQLYVSDINKLSSKLFRHSIQEFFQFFLGNQSVVLFNGWN